MTRIQDTLTLANGQLATGVMNVCWAPFTTDDDRAIGGGQINVTLTDGLVDIELEPNDTATPAGLKYEVRFWVNGKAWIERWIVPTSGTPVALAEVKA